MLRARDTIINVNFSHALIGQVSRSAKLSSPFEQPNRSKMASSRIIAFFFLAPLVILLVCILRQLFNSVKAMSIYLKLGEKKLVSR